MRNIIFRVHKFIFLSYYKTVILGLIIGFYLANPLSLHAESLDGIYIGYNKKANSLGHMSLETQFPNQLYGEIRLSSIACGGHLQGYLEQEDRRFIFKMEIPDPRGPQHQCRLLLQKDPDGFSILKETDCSAWHGSFCSFAPMQMQKTAHP